MEPPSSPAGDFPVESRVSEGLGTKLVADEEIDNISSLTDKVIKDSVITKKGYK